MTASGKRDMPSEERSVPLARVARVERGISWPKAAEVYEPAAGAVPVVRIGNVQPTGLDMTSRLYLTGLDEGTIARKTIDANTIIMVGSNGNADRIGNVCVATPKIVGYAYASFLIGIRPEQPDDLSYIAHVLKSERFQRAITNATSGSTGLKNIGLTWLRELAIPWPSPGERCRMAKLAEAAEVAEGAARRYATAARVAYETIRDDALRKFARTPLDRVLLRIGAGRSPRALARQPEPGERGVLKVSAVKPLIFLPSEAKALDPAVPMPEGARVQLGDLLITRANTAELVGAVCLVEMAPPDLFLCDKTLRLTVDEGEAIKRFLVHALGASDVRRQLRLAATGTSGSMKNISQDDIRRLEVALPSTSNEQNAIAARLDAMWAAVGAAEAEAARLASLRSALMQTMLQDFETGELAQEALVA